MVRTDGRKLLAAWIAADSTRNQALLASTLKVSEAAVSGWVRGKIRPSQRFRELLEMRCRIPRDAWRTGAERRELENAAKRFSATGTDGG